MWSNLDALDATDWLKRITQGNSVESGMRACLDKIEQTDKHINAFHHVFAGNALEQARVCDATPAEKRGPLHGLTHCYQGGKRHCRDSHSVRYCGNEHACNGGFGGGRCAEMRRGDYCWHNADAGVWHLAFYGVAERGSHA